MQRVSLVYIPREMVLLGLVEAALSFAAMYATITVSRPAATLSAMAGLLRPDATGLAAAMTIGAGLVGAASGLYRSDASLERKRVLSTTGLAAALSFLVLLLARGWVELGLTAVPVALFATMLAASLGTMTLIRLAYGSVAGRSRAIRRILLIGEPETVDVLKDRLRSPRGQSYVPVDLRTTDIDWKLVREHGIWGIVVAGPAVSAVGPLLDCKLRGVRVFGAADFQEHLLGRIDLDRVTAHDLLTGAGFVISGPTEAFKRGADVALAAAMLAATLPLFALIGLAIRIGDPGPIFSRHPRLGRFDKPFALYRFRTTAGASGSRATSIGRFIRATRIEELPQLINVIRGDLSLVGPRAERPQFAEQLNRAVPFYRQRRYVRPGLTGWAQINARYKSPVRDAREVLAHDLYYVKNRSVILDTFVLLSTLWLVLFPKGSR